MNGSSNAAGRQDAAMTLGLAPLSAAEQALLAGDDGWPWSTAGQCVICRLKQEATTSCERQDGGIERARGQCFSTPPAGRPQTVCKRCCIEALHGRRCRWWDLCWRDQESRRGACDGAPERV
jgi:hypothetical protein